MSDSFIHSMIRGNADDERLLSNVHPEDWENPTPDGRYNMVVIGAGTAGLVTAIGAAGLGARVALIERSLMGGDCLNVGCVPSKALLAAAKRIGEIRSATELGISASIEKIDFAAIMQRMRRLRADISPHDSASRFQEAGVDVFIGDGKFTSSNTVSVDGHELSFHRACVATGGRASAPPIPGLDSVEYLTNETLFDLTELPPSLLIIGAGPIGCEMAQCFSRFGANVSLVDRNKTVLSREEPDAAVIIQSQLEQDGVNLVLGQDLKQVRSGGEGIEIELANGDIVTGQGLLVAAGRKPNVDGLGLELAGVEYDPRTGVTVNDRLQTSNSSVYAAGDVCSRFQFTHTADFQARAVIQNALFPTSSKVSSLVIPWSTYTDPELARVGKSAAELASDSIEFDTYTQSFDGSDRAILESETAGFARIHTAKGTDRILGATVVGKDAGDLIAEVTMAMTNKLGVSAIGKTIHPYPTRSDTIRRLGDQYSKTRLSPFVKSLFEKWLSWRRS